MKMIGYYDIALIFIIIKGRHALPARHSIWGMAAALDDE